MIFRHSFVANLVLNLVVIEFGKYTLYVSIWQSYRQWYSGSFFSHIVAKPNLGWLCSNVRFDKNIDKNPRRNRNVLTECGLTGVVHVQCSPNGPW